VADGSIARLARLLQDLRGLGDDGREPPVDERTQIGVANREPERAQSLATASHPPKHPSVALLWSSLGNLVRSFGPDHPDVATALVNVSRILRRQAKTTHVLARIARAIEIRERVHGKDALLTAAARNNRAVILADLQEHEEAIAELRRVRTIVERTLPPSHGDRAIPVRNIDVNLPALGRAAEGPAHLREGIATASRLYGPSHPSPLGTA
jgi:hypothetical protein